MSDPHRIEVMLMSFDAYVRLGVVAPHVIELQRGEGRLLYYGGRHVWDPRDPQVRDIVRRFRHFRPTLVFNEGGHPLPEPPLSAAVRKHGEAGLAVFLAQKAGVEHRSLEPPRLAEARELQRVFAAEQVKLFYFLRDFDSYNRSAFPETRERYANILFDNLQHAGLRGPPADLDECRALCRRFVPELRRWYAAPSAWFDPAADVHPWLNDATRRSSRVRDVHMVRTLLAALRQGHRVFAVVGYSHVVMQEPALLASNCLSRS